jgi:hypothetical protein
MRKADTQEQRHQRNYDENRSFLSALPRVSGENGEAPLRVRRRIRSVFTHRLIRLGHAASLRPWRVSLIFGRWPAPPGRC